MIRRHLPSLLRPSACGAALGLLITLAAPRPAAALQPLEVFLGSAKGAGFENREAKAVAEQRSLEADGAWYGLLPTFTATGRYVYNNVAYDVPTASGPRVGIPANLVDGAFRAEVPVIDVGRWERIGVARRQDESSKVSAENVRLETEKQIARAFYTIVALEAVVKSAELSVDVSKKNLDFLEKRQAAGVAPELDVKRAIAEVERNKQQVTDAKYQVSVARRNLATLSGVEPSAEAPELVATLEPEAPLPQWEGTDVEKLPSVRAASLQAQAAQRDASAKRAELIPTVTLAAQERLTNAVGFANRSDYFTVEAQATWRWDTSVLPLAAAKGAAADAATARADKQRALAKDGIVNAWRGVGSAIEKAQAARVQQDAAKLAADLSKQRYQAGAATYLDVVSTDRERFAADVALIQADTEVIYARAALRLAAGKSLLEGK